MFQEHYIASTKIRERMCCSTGKINDIVSAKVACLIVFIFKFRPILVNEKYETNVPLKIVLWST